MAIRLIRTTLIVALSACIPTDHARARVIEISPGQDYRSVLRKLEPGDELVFLPGEHHLPAKVRVSGTPEKPILLRGRPDSAGRLPEITWTQRGENTWDVYGKYLRISDLQFHSRNHCGMRIREATDIQIQNCVFRDNGENDLTVNSGAAASVHILHCRFVGGKQTPVYIGNHDGHQVVTDFRFEGNLIDGSRINDANIVGYGIQLKLNVDGVVRNNLILGTQGPAIMVYGFQDAKTSGKQLVENNIVVGARNSHCIVVGGGPVTVRNNLVIAGDRGGIDVADYGNRNLLDGIAIIGNVVLGGDDRWLNVSRHARTPKVERNVKVESVSTIVQQLLPNDQAD
ncbi:MAG: right-handed parallel beta-helix repeat-containing protein [Pirellulaceae bacterium]